MSLVWDVAWLPAVPKASGYFNRQPDLETVFATQLPDSWTLVNTDPLALLEQEEELSNAPA